MVDDCCIVALGNSLTEGFGVRPEDSFPVRLEGLLRRRGTDCRVINRGRSGDTCRGFWPGFPRLWRCLPTW